MTVDSDRPGAGTRSAGPAQAGLLAVRFATELALLAVLALAGADARVGLAGQSILAVAGPVAAAIIWALWIAPRARYRLTDPLRLAVEIVVFAVASATLAVADRSFSRSSSRSWPSASPCWFA